MKSIHRHLRYAVAVAALALPMGALAQQDGKQIDGATLLSADSDPVESSKYLDKVYKNETEGFRLAPPSGSRIVQRRGVDLVSFIVDNKSWGGSLQRLNFNGRDAMAAGQTGRAQDALQSQDPISMAELIANIKKELPKTFKAVQVLQEKRVKDFEGGKMAVRLDVSMQAELGATIGMKANAPARGAADDVVVAIMRQQLIIQTQTDKNGKGTQYYFLTLYSPLKDKDAAVRTFEAMLGAFELFDTKTLYESRKSAVATGKAWLTRRSAEEFSQKSNGQTQFFLQQVETKNVGFIALTEVTKVTGRDGRVTEVERGGRKGVQMNVKFASFGANSVNYGQIDEFWGNSKDARGQILGDYSEWNIITKTQIKDPLPPGQTGPGGLPYRLLTPWLQETGNILQDSPKQRPRILVTYGGDAKQKLPQGVEAVMPEGNTATPLPKVLEYTWTRFVDVTTPTEMSFTTFDSRNNKLALRTLVVTGKQESIKVNGKTVTGYKCNDEIDPNFTTLWVDKQGQILLMKTSDQSVFQPTTSDAVDKLWPNRPTE